MWIRTSEAEIAEKIRTSSLGEKLQSKKGVSSPTPIPIILPYSSLLDFFRLQEQNKIQFPSIFPHPHPYHLALFEHPPPDTPQKKNQKTHLGDPKIYQVEGMDIPKQEVAKFSYGRFFNKINSKTLLSNHGQVPKNRAF